MSNQGNKCPITSQVVTICFLVYFPQNVRIGIAGVGAGVIYEVSEISGRPMQLSAANAAYATSFLLLRSC